MSFTQSANPRMVRRAGLSVIEMLISLSIASLLLTAAAAAFNVSSSAVQTNDEFFRASQAARISLHQMLTQIRRGSVQLDWDPHSVRLITAPESDDLDGDDITYRYLPDSDQLQLITNDIPDDADHTLASNVSDLAFDVESGVDYNNSPCVARVTVTIKVRVGSNEVMLSGAAAPRRNLKY